MSFKLNTFLKGGLTLLMIIMLGSFANAQRTVKGKVTDATSGEALIGANVLAKGTTSGAVTDLDGMYSVSIPAGASAIEVSYAGYETQTIPLGTSNVVDVALKAGRVLEDVVVVGYGSVKKSDATGAVNAITEKDFNKGVITSPEQLMQGRVAGVQISQGSGEPGGGINVRIRGTSSVRGNNNPLFVIDGVPLAGDDVSGNGIDAGFGRSSAKNPLNFMNPNDIEKIDILKDASATAIYGARGANGVVLITTKSGKGKGSLNYGYSLGISNITKKYDLLSAEDFKRANPTADLGGSTDWQDEVLRTGLTHNHDLSYGAGNDKGSYRFSFNYMNQDGIIENSNVKRYTARFNADHRFFNDRLKVGVQSTVANVLDTNVPVSEDSGFEGDLIGAMVKSNPTMKAYTKGDTLNQISTTEPNPLAYLRYSKDNTNTIRAQGNLNAELKIFEGLTFKSVLGFDRSLSSRKAAYSSDFKMARIYNIGRMVTSDVGVSNNTFDNYFTYSKKAGKIDVTALAGYSYQSFNNFGKSFIYARFPTSDLNIMINNQASAQLFAPRNSYNTEDEIQSYFGRLNFSFDNKYLLTATFRRDGSTRFGAENRYGNFPSLAAKWRLIQENFIPKSLFSDLSLRASWGITGNQELPHNVYTFRSRYADYSFDDDVKVVRNQSVSFPATANPGLKWETTKQINLGLDFGFVNNRISGSIEFYDKRTSDLLMRVVNPQPALTPFVWKNLNADIQNRGVELSLNIVAVSKKDFSWDVNFNVAHNKNLIKKLEGLYNTGRINGQGLSGAFAQQLAEGQPMYAFFLRDFDGFTTDGLAQKYVNGLDQQIFLDGKSPLPTVTGGITNTVRFKNFDASVFFNGVFGNYIYSNTANAFFTAGALGSGRNVTKDVIGNGENAANSPDVSDRFLEKGDFVRLSNLALGYNINTSSKYISGIRLFLNAQNLLTFTKYSGQDPEVSTNKQIDDVPSFGIDYTAYPRARTITIGANVSF